MANDNQPAVQSPQWWLSRLANKLAADQSKFTTFENYYSGNHPLPVIPRELDRRYLDQFREIIQQSRANFMELVIDAAVERLHVQGFRLSAQSNAVADQESWRIWQANSLDAESALLFGNTLKHGRGYLSVWNDGSGPTIAVEDAQQVIVETEPGNRRQRAAALKVWLDDWTNTQRANVYLPDGIYKYQRKSDETLTAGEAWTALPDETAAFVSNPVGVVPIVPLINRPKSSPDGQSEIESVIPIQDRINSTIFNRVLAGWFTAFRQRWASGIEIPHDPSTNQPVEPFKAAIDRLWVSENPEAHFGEFSQTDLAPYIAAHERDIQDIAVITRTPRHYLFQSGQSPSGDAIKSAETGLVAKARAKMIDFSDSLEEALNLARVFGGETDVPVDSEIIWADPEYKSDSEISDAVVKQYAAGLVTLETAQEVLGYSPIQIQRMVQQRKDEPAPPPINAAAMQAAGTGGQS